MNAACTFKSFKLWIISFAALALFFTGCEDVGLGAAIDTQAPSLAITYPPEAARAIRGTFTVAGSCDDDRGVTEISVVVKSIDRPDQVFGPYKAKIAASKKTYSIELNQYDLANSAYYNGYQYADGKYSVGVTAYDDAGHFYGPISRTVEIDNTAPLFVVTTPSVAYNTASAVPLARAPHSEYGSIFKVEGTIADDHDVDSMRIDIFDSNGTKLTANGFIEKEVETSGGTSIVFARFIEGSDKTVHQRYTEIYGADPAAGEKLYSCTITLTDNAKEYKNPQETANASSGNATTKIYLYSNVYSKLMSAKDGYGLELGDLKNVLNGTLTGENITKSSKAVGSAQVLELLKKRATDTGAAERLAFSLNPNADPYYELSGYAIDTARLADRSALKFAGKNSTITFVAKPGLDGILIRPETVRLYLKQFEESEFTKENVEAFIKNPKGGRDPKKLREGFLLLENYAPGDPNTPRDPLDASKPDASKIYDGGAVSYYTKSVSLPATIIGGRYYALAATGSDADGVTFSKQLTYGFAGAIVGSAPLITVTEPAADLAVVKTSGAADLTYKGIVVSEDGLAIEYVDAEVTVTDEENAGAPVAQITGRAELDAEGHWSFAPAAGAGYAAAAVAPDSGKAYLYTAKFTAYAAGLRSRATRTTHVDSKKPDVEIKSIAPVIGDGAETAVNGVIVLSGTAKDTNLKDVRYEVYIDGAVHPYAHSSAKGSFGAAYSYSLRLDTRNFPDEKTVKIVITAEDSVGNTASSSSEVYNGAKPIRISQKTDKPAIALTTAQAGITAASQISMQKNLFGTVSNNLLLATVTDDDAVKAVSVTLYDKDGALLPASGVFAGYANPALFDAGEKSVYPLSYRLPEKEGVYQVKVEAFDRNYDGAAPAAASAFSKNDTGKFFIAVDTGAPTVTMSEPANGVYKGKNFSIAGTVSKSDSPLSAKFVNQSGAEVTIAGALFSPLTVTPPTVPGNPAQWSGSVTMPDHASEEYHVLVTAKDTYAQEGSAKVSFKVDLQSPTFTVTQLGKDAPLSTPLSKDSAEHAVYVNPADGYVVRGTASDGTGSGRSGLKGIYYYIAASPLAPPVGDAYAPLDASGRLNAGWSAANAVSDGTVSKWTVSLTTLGTLPVQDGTQGYRLYLCAVDEAGNISSVSENPSAKLVIRPDGEKPSCTVMAANVYAEGHYDSPYAGALSVNGRYYAKSAFDITAAYTEPSDSFDKIELYEDGALVAPVGGTNNKWSFNHTDSAVYNYTVYVSDKAGNVQSRSFIVFYDAKLPEVTLATIAPMVTADGIEKVNGVITVKGSVSDNTNLSSAVSWNVDGNTGGAGLSGTIPVAGTSAQWQFDLDTSLLSDDAHRIRVSVSDFIGNTQHIEKEIVVDQTTDRPVIKPTNANPAIRAKSAITAGSGIDNIFGTRSNKKLTALITDDDGVKEVRVGVRPAKDAPNTDPYTETALFSNGTSNSVSISYDLPAEEGAYDIRISVTDTVGTLANSTAALDYFTVAVDDGAPVFERVTPNTAAFYSESVAVAGKLKDGSGVIRLKADVSSVTGAASTKSTEALVPASGDWNDSITLAGVVDGRDYAVMYTATDGYGQSSTQTVRFHVDKSAPTLTIDGTRAFSVGDAHVSSGAELAALGAKYFKSGTLDFSGFYTEDANGSGLKKVYYWLNKPDAPTSSSAEVKAAVAASSFNGEIYSASNTGLYRFASSIAGFATAPSGVNTICFAAEDNAGNFSLPARITIHYDSAAPEQASPARYKYDGAADASLALGAAVITNTQKAITLTGSASDKPVGTSDASSGIDFVTVWAGSESNRAAVTGSDNWTAVFDTATLARLSGSPEVHVISCDKAGNKTDTVLCTFTVDTQAPNVSIGEPAANGTVNKKISITGSAFDDQELEGSAELYALTGAGTYTRLVHTALASGAWAFTDIDTADSAAVMRYDADGNAGNGTQLKVQVRIKDKAGNEGVAERLFTVDQDSDRPVVRFNNITVASAAKITTNQITGIINDDDGYPESGSFAGSEPEGVWYTTDASQTVPDASKVYDAASNPGGVWFPVTVDNGSFSIDDTTGDGEKRWYFWIKDKAGTVFRSGGATALERPYFTDRNTAVGDAAANTAHIAFSLDTTPPAIDTVAFFRKANGDFAAPDKDDAGWSTESSALTFGGEVNVMFVKIAVTEKTAMRASDPVTLKIDDAEVNLSGAIRADLVSPSGYAYVVGPVILNSAYTDGTASLTIEVYDASNGKGQSTKNIVIDNTAPTVAVATPASTTRITSTVTVRGAVSDNAGGSGTDSVKWMIAPSGVTPNAATAGWQDMTSGSGGASWTIEFMNTAPNHPMNPLTYCDTTRYNVRRDTGNGSFYYVPVHFLMKDKLGNARVTPFEMLVDTDGGKPVASILAPENESSVGGLIRVYGSAADIDGTIKSVQIQMDLNNDGSFTQADYDIVKSWADNGIAPYAGHLHPAAWSGSALSSDWGIEIEGGAESWSIMLNQNKELDANVSKRIGMRVRAYDQTDLTHGWGAANVITINIDAPLIGSSEQLVLKQYSDNHAGTGSVVAEKQYSEDMWISGRWWLCCSVEDTQGISDIIFSSEKGSLADKLKSPSSGAVFEEKVYKVDTATFPGHKDYLLKIPLDASRSDGIKIRSKLTVTDDSIDKNSADRLISINVDDTAPSLYKTDGSETQAETDSLRLMSGLNMLGAAHSVVQSNFAFELGDTVKESGAGFERLAFYFKRAGYTGDAAARVYNPMFAPDKYASCSNRTDIAAAAADGALYINEEKLPAFRCTGSFDSLQSFTAANPSAVNDNYNVRRGGLVKINGVYAVITGVDRSGGKITFDTPVAAPSPSVSVEFIYAQVVDHLANIESPVGTTLDDEGNLKVSPNTDDPLWADGMIESIEKIGTNFKWSASVNSKHLVDGPIEIHVVAFDKAGNWSHGFVTTKVENNRPRIARVLLATDLNGNDKFNYDTAAATFNGAAANGEFCTYSALDGTNKTVFRAAINSSAFTAKNKLLVLPEFVNDSGSLTGNGELGYVLGIAEATAADLSDAATGTPTALTDKAALITNIADTALGAAPAEIQNKISEKGGMILSNADLGAGAADGAKKLQITFWDHTEGLAYGSKTQWAVLNIPLTIDVVDQTPPMVALAPFYWEGKEKNSLYGNDTDAGHIELSADLPASFTSTGSGVDDRDPKVSGKITLRGSAYDDQNLSALYVLFDEFTPTAFLDGETLLVGGKTYYKAAKYNAATGAWVSASADMASSDWQFTVKTKADPTAKESDDMFGSTVAPHFDQNGHKVYWQLDINTAKIAGAAHADVHARILAVDRAPNESSESAAGAAGNDAAYNNPFCKMDVVPYITSIDTALNSIKKRNPTVYSRTARGNYPVRADETITVNGFNLDVSGASSITYAIGSMTSGAYTHTVNGIASLNNRNGNDAHGSASAAALDEYERYANFYNRRPNKDNNNRLTDDVVIDVWEFAPEAAKPISGGIEQPVMKINPKTDMIGFAFVNGPLYFSMGGKVGGTEYSDIYWMGSYDFFTSVGFIYDSLGYSYGCAAGGDINNNSADKFQFMTSRWGRAGTGQSGSYNRTNSLRLESIGQKDSGVNIFNKQRIKSPSFAAAVHGSATNLYLAYYDDINQEVRFKYGKISTTAFSTHSCNFGSFTDHETGGEPKDYMNDKVSMIAGSSTNRKAGEYVSLGVVSQEGSGVDDVVVCVWYDSVNRTLWYTYNDSPTTNRDGQTDGSGWSAPVRVFADGSVMEESGEFCQIAVDKDGGIHIAAYDPVNLDLDYAYSSGYNAASFESCVVDGYGVVGSNITIDVAKNAAGKNIPYIGYYATSCIKPKLAYLADTSASAPSGSDDELFTGAWEVSVVPSSSNVNKDRINIGVWKDSSGTIKNSKTGFSYHTNTGSSYGATCEGEFFANGTPNPLLAYAHKQSSSAGYIETAQKK